NAVHPRGSWRNFSRSDVSTDFAGQPTCSASGRGIASTSGEVASGGCSPGARLGCFSAPRRASRTFGQIDDPGTHTAGRGPSVASFQPLASAAMVALSSLVTILARTHSPGDAAITAARV